MKKLLFIGNSHLATMKESEHIANYKVDYIGFSFQSNFNIDFFENTRTGDGIQIPDNSPSAQKKLWKITTGSPSSLALEGYDAYFIVGIITPPNPWRGFSHFDGLLNNTNIPPISFDCYVEIIRSLQAEEIRLANYIQAVIRKNSRGRLIFFIPLPYVRDDAELFNRGLTPPTFWTALPEEDKAILISCEASNYKKALAHFGIELLIPPASLVTNGNRCPAIFSKGALGSPNFADSLNPAWGDDDLSHKNIEYGKEWWEYINKLTHKIF
jgi:hypothetical protein